MSCPDEFIVQVKMDNFYCMMCGCHLAGYDAILDHLSNGSHEIAVNQYGKDISMLGSHNYYCSICNSVISGFVNVNVHLNGRKHNMYLSSGNATVEEEGEEEEFEGAEEFFMFEGEEEHVEFDEGEEDAEYYEGEEDAEYYEGDEDAEDYEGD